MSDVIDKALKKVTKGRDVHVNRLYFFNDELPLYKKDIESVFCKIVQKSLESLKKDGHGSLRVVTRPKGRLAEVEISDTGLGINTEEFLKSEDGETIDNILKKHRGRLNLTSKAGSGTTYVIDLPAR